MAIIRRDPKKLPIEINSITGIDAILEEARSKGIITTPFDIRAFINLCVNNLKIVEEKMGDDNISGYIEKRNDIYIISVNKYHAETRKRFTIAHEYAHYLYDRNLFEQKNKHYEDMTHEPKLTKPIELTLFRDQNFNKEQIEQRANHFASMLLIQENELREILKTEQDIETLAEYFKVSPAAMYIRMKWSN